MNQILKVKDITEALGLSRTTIYRMERAGTFPQRIRLGPNSVCWDPEQVAAWLATRPRGFTNAQPNADPPTPRKAG